MDILTLYNCEAFPDYHYKASKIDVAVVSPYTYTATTALYDPRVYSAQITMSEQVTRYKTIHIPNQINGGKHL